jgi:hypothetical protein
VEEIELIQKNTANEGNKAMERDTFYEFLN